MTNDSKTEAPDFLPPYFEWTDDSQGKKDYDGPLLSVSTRYWPPSYDQRGLHTARASILWGDPATSYRPLMDREFSAGSLEEIKNLVEAWVAAQAQVMFDRLRA